MFFVAFWRDLVDVHAHMSSSLVIYAKSTLIISYEKRDSEMANKMSWGGAGGWGSTINHISGITS